MIELDDNRLGSVLSTTYGEFGLISVIISTPSKHSNGSYELKFEDLRDMGRVGFTEKEGKAGMFFGGIFYPISSIHYMKDGTPQYLTTLKKNKLTNKTSEFSNIGETENFYIMKKEMYK